MDFVSATLSGDALSAFLVLVLLAMSVTSWSVILYKVWLLHRVSADVKHGKAAFWQARDMQQGLQALAAVERAAVLLPLAQANQPSMSGTLAAQGDMLAQRTRVLRDALHGIGVPSNWLNDEAYVDQQKKAQAAQQQAQTQLAAMEQGSNVVKNLGLGKDSVWV